jgi:hypothetical protein
VTAGLWLTTVALASAASIRVVVTEPGIVPHISQMIRQLPLLGQGGMGVELASKIG